MKDFLKKNWPIILLLTLSLLTRFLFLNYPAEVVFDEVHFGKFVSAYFTHQYYFDIHPPLGKLMIAGFAKLFGFDPTIGFEQIGETVSASTLLVLRFLPALFGCLLPILIYGLLLVFGASRRTAFLGGFLVIFDNAILVESKFILVDSFLFFFGFLSLLVFLLSQKQENRLKKHLLYFLSMALAALAFSIKWTGLVFLGINLLFFCARMGAQKELSSFSFFSFLKTINLKRFFKFFAEVFISLALFAFVYALPFAIHFKLLPLSGPGDAFMSQEFQHALSGNKLGSEIKAIPFSQKFVELNKAMLYYNAGLTRGHPDASHWQEWPLMKKPVWYWTKSVKEATANIYLLGNFVIWVGVIIFLPLGFFFFLKSFFDKHYFNLKYPLAILFFGYFLNLLPYIFVSRAAFLYHYLPSLIFGILILCLCFERLLPEKLPSGYMALAVISFLIFSPLSYGFFLGEKAFSWYKIFLFFLR